MELILLHDVEKLGFKDEIVNVKSGYGRNFLIPGGKAVLATEAARKVLEENLRQRAKKENKLIDDSNKIAEKINGLTVTIAAKTVEGGKQLFGSITSNHLAEELEKLGFTVDKKFVKLNNVKTVGVYDAEVRLHREVKASLSVEVVAAK
ncbi:MAG: 50S ribosomal protein L9 [Flavobacteriales bacterium]|jgi:large subunit ribosomal protein L9|nr:50S ribosomal protein L9 [Flavobacteriales bacterium]MDG1188910.1 50S ribosomal protein L9 [Flavobacteriales bacterium]